MDRAIAIFALLILTIVEVNGICQEGVILNYTHGEYTPSCIGGTKWNYLQCGIDEIWCWCVHDDGIEMENTMTKKSAGIPQCARESDEEEAALSAAIVYLIVFLMLLVALIVTIICIICKAKSAHIIRARETLVDDDVEMDDDRGQAGDSLTDPPQPFLPPPPPTPPIPKNQSSFKPPEVDSLPAPIFPIPPPR